MHITNDIKYLGVNDHQVDLFEGQYVVPNGMAYNSYAIMDEKVAIMDTVDQHFTHQWLDNIQNSPVLWALSSSSSGQHCQCFSSLLPTFHISSRLRSRPPSLLR